MECVGGVCRWSVKVECIGGVCRWCTWSMFQYDVHMFVTTDLMQGYYKDWSIIGSTPSSVATPTNQM